MCHLPRLPVLLVFCFLENATLSSPEHTHHMNRQVRRSVSVQYRNNHPERRIIVGLYIIWQSEAIGRLHQPAESISLAVHFLKQFPAVLMKTCSC